jgi:imidazolonepropionase-like amidohydrolase
MAILFKNAKKVILGNGSVLEATSVKTDGVTIATIGRDLPEEGAEVVDCSGKIVMPGLIDVHVHVGMWAGEVDWGNILDIPDEYLGMRATTYLTWWIQNGTSRWHHSGPASPSIWAGYRGDWRPRHVLRAAGGYRSR